MGLGLSETDAKIYTFLAKKGPLIGRELSKALGVNKQQIYRSIFQLRNKGLVNATSERSIRFQAVPFEKVLDLFVKSRIEEAEHIQRDKNKLLSP